MNIAKVWSKSNGRYYKINGKKNDNGGWCTSHLLSFFISNLKVVVGNWNCILFINVFWLIWYVMLVSPVFIWCVLCIGFEPLKIDYEVWKLQLHAVLEMVWKSDIRNYAVCFQFLVFYHTNLNLWRIILFLMH